VSSENGRETAKEKKVKYQVGQEELMPLSTGNKVETAKELEQMVQ
jgi:hypothetical protein